MLKFVYNISSCYRGIRIEAQPCYVSPKFESCFGHTTTKLKERVRKHKRHRSLNYRKQKSSATCPRPRPFPTQSPSCSETPSTSWPTGARPNEVADSRPRATQRFRRSGTLPRS